MQELSIEQARYEEPNRLWDLIAQLGYHKDTEYFEQCFERQEKDELQLLIVSMAGVDIGYCVMNWAPKYAYFKVHNIPEIQDLNVLKDYRRRGIGRKVIEYCEALARDKGCREMGIGVGVDYSYGPAQRLYVKMGYIPDGQGVSYDRKQVAHGEFRPIDDNLCLMMTKTLD